MSVLGDSLLMFWEYHHSALNWCSSMMLADAPLSGSHDVSTLSIMIPINWSSHLCPTLFVVITLWMFTHSRQSCRLQNRHSLNCPFCLCLSTVYFFSRFSCIYHLLNVDFLCGICSNLQSGFFFGSGCILSRMLGNPPSFRMCGSFHSICTSFLFRFFRAVLPPALSFSLNFCNVVVAHHIFHFCLKVIFLACFF